MAIHPTSVVHEGAQIHPTAEVGPFCVVGPWVSIGARTRLVAHVCIDNDTTLGEDNTVYPFASLGTVPQDLKFKGERSRLVIGNGNTIRESVTMNLGTEGGHMETRIGDGCLFMAYSHVAHDCLVGNRVVLANSAALAGHVTLGDNVILGGIAGIHQFCRVGRNAFLAGGAMVTQDVPPFCIAKGDRAQLVSINVVGLRRGGWSRERIHLVREGFRRLFHSEGTRLSALESTEQELAPKSEEVREMCAFIREAKRGVCAPRRGLPTNDADDE